MFQQEEFLKHYHQRSNVESAFSAIKRKFGGSVRSKIPDAQANEVLCKILCYNLSCLALPMFELGITVTFYPDKTPAVAAGLSIHSGRKSRPCFTWSRASLPIHTLL